MKEAVVFPGQGVQKKGMFMDFLHEFDVVKKVFEEASDVTGIDIIKLCSDGDEKELSLTTNSQPIVLACDIAAWELYKQKKRLPDYVAGFSLGEYAALYAAGCLSLKDVFKVIVVRAKAMQDAVPVGMGAMAAVMYDSETEEKVFNYFESKEKDVWIANYNTRGQITITGRSKAVQKTCEDLSSMDVVVKRLPVSAPFHCGLLVGVEEKLEKILGETTFADGNIPVICNLDGIPETNAEILKQKVIKQAVSPVQWIKTMEYMNNKGVSVYTECGPGRTLSNFIKKMRFNQSKQYNLNAVKCYMDLEGS